MGTRAEQVQENKSEAGAQGLAQQQNRGASTFQFNDQRPAAQLQRKQQQTMANSARANSARVAQLKHVDTSYAGNYDGNEVRTMLDASQGRNGSTGAAGHVREHVKDAAGTKAYAFAEKKKKTCYVNDAQQNKAVTSGLNSSTGQTELAKFDTTANNRVVIAGVGVDQVNAWQSDWDATKNDSTKSKKIHATNVTLVVDRLPGLNRPEIHVQTAYPS